MGPAGRSSSPALALLTPGTVSSVSLLSPPVRPKRYVGPDSPGQDTAGGAGQAWTDPRLPQEGAHFLKGPSDSLATGHNGKPHPTFNRQGVTVDSMILLATLLISLRKQMYSVFQKAPGQGSWQGCCVESDKQGERRGC